MDNKQKAWLTPEIVLYGSVEEITAGECGCKKKGSGDDLGTSIEYVPGCSCDCS